VKGEKNKNKKIKKAKHWAIVNKAYNLQPLV
jgi:hypothetical protein